MGSPEGWRQPSCGARPGSPQKSFAPAPHACSACKLPQWVAETQLGASCSSDGDWRAIQTTLLKHQRFREPGVLSTLAFVAGKGARRKPRLNPVRKVAKSEPAPGSVKSREEHQAPVIKRILTWVRGLRQIGAPGLQELLGPWGPSFHSP
eukprot:13243186-Alexandrium_andersonii.AAC.1